MMNSFQQYTTSSYQNNPFPSSAETAAEEPPDGNNVMTKPFQKYARNFYQNNPVSWSTETAAAAENTTSSPEKPPVNNNNMMMNSFQQYSGSSYQSDPFSSPYETATAENSLLLPGNTKTSLVSRTTVLDQYTTKEIDTKQQIKQEAQVQVQNAPKNDIQSNNTTNYGLDNFLMVEAKKLVCKLTTQLLQRKFGSNVAIATGYKNQIPGLLFRYRYSGKKAPRQLGYGCMNKFVI